MNAPLYTTEILRLAAGLAEPTTLERVDGRAERRSPTCGSVIVAEVQLDREGRVAALTQTVQACAFGQASAAILAAGAAGSDGTTVQTGISEIEQWLAGEGGTPGWPGIAALAPARTRKSRHAAILLPFQALAAAIESAR
jgi:NifU-like protein involved in Fe-S cluster formation